MPRLAWFSPLPPVRSGIARYCSELLPGIAIDHDIDLYADGPPRTFDSPDSRVRLFEAHDFIWKHRARPYDLIVYQLGNAPCHDYMWAYLVRYPGLAVLHDGQLHHARGRMLLQHWQPRIDDYRREFWFNHPDANPDLAELGVAGLLGSLTYLWPMLRVVIESSRRVLVHNEWLAAQMRSSHPTAEIDVVDMGVPPAAPGRQARRRVRARHGIAEDAVVFAVFGKVTPEKRVREAMRALAAVAPAVPRAHLLVAGEPVDYYDMRSEAEELGVSERVTLAGYLPDEDIDDYLEAADVCICMRWPTSRETSASWLRCMAAGKPTIATDLVHTVDVPTLDPRSWSLLAGLKAGTTSTSVTAGTTDAAAGTTDAAAGAADARAAAGATDAGARPAIGDDPRPVGVSIDVLDEDHSLKLAMRRLAVDHALRTALGDAARALWADRFSLARMVDGYRRAIGRALDAPGTPRTVDEALPQHLRSTGAEHAESLLKEILGSEYHLRDAD